VSDRNTLQDPKLQDNSTSSLPRVSRERDLLIDDDHRTLDVKIARLYNIFRRHNEEPLWSALLSSITLEDKRLVTLTRQEAEDLLTRQPSIKVILQKAWKEASFKELRQLSEFFFVATLLLYDPLTPLKTSSGLRCKKYVGAPPSATGIDDDG
jgi:hypothetical protein